MSLIVKVVNKLRRPVVKTIVVKKVAGSSLLKEKTALVVGGNRGIGASIVDGLREHGARVVVASRSITTIRGKRYQWDVSDIARLEPVFNEIIRDIGKLDIFVASQGICPDIDFRAEFMQVTSEDFEDVLRINLESVYFLNQIVCRYYIKEHIAGNILNIASTEGLRGVVVPYGVAKWGVVGLTKGLGREMAKYNIVVNAIAPGATVTDMMRRTLESDLSYGIPSGRMSHPQEIAEMAVYLVSDAGRQMCGSVIPVDGGESLK